MKRLLHAILATVCFCAAPTLAQELPPIYQKAPRRVAKREVVATFPAKTFLENLVTTASGDLFVTSYEEGRVYRIAPGKQQAVFAKLSGNIAGIVAEPDGTLLVTGQNRQKQQLVCRIGKTGTISDTVVFDDALFLNGITHFDGDTYLIADSYRGVLWLFNARTGAKSVWLASPVLTRADPKNPFPAANGVKVYKNTVLVTNTARRLLLRIPVLAGNKPGKPTVLRDNVNLDDFAADAQGNLYATTHVYDSVVRITPNGDLTVIAENVFGTTSAQFGQSAKDRDFLYVTTNGGMSYPPKSGVQKAQVIRLQIVPPKKGARP